MCLYLFLEEFVLSKLKRLVLLLPVHLAVDLLCHEMRAAWFSDDCRKGGKSCAEVTTLFPLLRGGICHQDT